MIKRLILVGVLLMFAGMAAGQQIKDTTVLIDKGKGLDMGKKREYVTNKDSISIGKIAYPALTISAQFVYDISPKSVGRDTLTFRDTLTPAHPFATYNLGSQYTYVTIAITRGDTNRTNMDSIAAYSLSTYLDTTRTGLRNLRTFTDGDVGMAGSGAFTTIGSATQKYMLLDPICKYLHIRAVNAVLTNRVIILTIRAVRQ
jgi:hypothetical protein